MKALNILCVEDNPGDAGLLHEMLKETGIGIGGVIRAETLSQARQKFTPKTFDVIFLDLSLPDAQGLVTVQQMKAVAPDVPIVVMTGLNDEAVGLQCIQMGAHDYLVKGHCDGALLKRVLRYVIESERAESLTRITAQLQSEIADRENTEARLTEALKQLEGQTQALDQFAIVAETDAAGRITHVNDLFCKISKYSREELLGKDHREVVNSGYHPKAFWKKMWSTIGHGQVWQGEIKNRAKDGSIYWVDTAIVPFPDSHGKPYKYLAIRAVITERKEAEAALGQARDVAVQSVRLKSEFMANMSHEIRTPMNAIIGMSELLSETVLTPIQKTYVDVFRRSGEHLLTVINDILDLSTVESGVLQLEKIDFNLMDLMEDTLKLLAIPAQEKGLKLAYHIAPNVPLFLSGDPDRLRQVITNVIGNAIKFTKKGDVLLRIKNDIPVEKGLPCRLQFSVKDTGIGIAPEKLNAVFESFVQGDSSITRKYGGTGLGLTISKKLVELMGGHIRVMSELGVGTSFYFDIPFDTPKVHPSIMAVPPLGRSLRGGQSMTIGQVPGDVPMAGGAARAIRILLVEDSPDNQLLVLAYLKTSGHTVEVADNGEIAVKMVTEGPYDLILMDMQMPVMDGYTSTRAIRVWETQNAKSSTPIIALTAYALKEEIQKSLHAGCTAHMTKPIKKAILMDVIGQYAKEESRAA